MLRDNRFEQLFHAAQRRFEFWDATAEDKIVIMADTGTYKPLLEACHAAAVALGADVTVVTYSARRRPFLDIPKPAEVALLQATFYLTIMQGRWSYSASMQRVLTDPKHENIKTAEWDGDEDSIYHFVELLPDERVIERTERALKLINAAQVIQVKSDLGTDLTLERGDPGKVLAYAPAGQVAIAAPPESVNGTMMFVGGHRTRMPGPDVGHRRMVYDPVRIEFENGYITDIAQDNADGRFLHHWFHSWKDQEVNRFAHINLGLDHRVRLDILDNIAVHYNYGGLLFGVGVMNSPLFGHQDFRQAKSHIELQLTGTDYYLDGRQIMKGGEFMPDTGLRHVEE